jgi:hypothetical protein
MSCCCLVSSDWDFVLLSWYYTTKQMLVIAYSRKSNLVRPGYLDHSVSCRVFLGCQLRLLLVTCLAQIKVLALLKDVVLFLCLSAYHTGKSSSSNHMMAIITTVRDFTDCGVLSIFFVDCQLVFAFAFVLVIVSLLGPGSVL